MIKVVSCFWNAEKYIGKCVESLQMQKFKDFKKNETIDLLKNYDEFNLD